MHSSHWRPHALCGLTLILLSGCQTYSPYGYGYPGTYAPPGGAVMPQQSFPAPPPGTYAPGGSLGNPAPAPAPAGPQQNFMTPRAPGAPGGDAPAWNGTSTGTSNEGNLVPDPPHGSPDDLGGPGAFNSRSRPQITQVSGQEEEGEPRQLQPAAPLETASASTPVNEAPDEFEAPVEATVAPVQHTAASSPNPHDYDPVSYSFLRGTVDYSKEDNSWHIIYNLTPDEKDKLGGGVRLLPHPALKTLRNNDVVLIEGKVDYENREPGGKPQYRISHLARLTPAK